jgi:MYXO-CTERM domain-containing protein
MKFLFTKEAVFERALVDGHDGPVTNKVILQNQTPQMESLDVDFADGSGKIFKGTRFDFGLTRDRGYEAGEYKVVVRTSDGSDIGSAQHLTLNGENPVVDRRAITFAASNKSVKKVDNGVDGGANGPPKTSDDDAPSAQNQDVQATGTATPFIAPDAYNKTPEEEVKTHPAGCGCVVAGASDSPASWALGAFGAAWALVYARSSRSRSRKNRG